MMAWISVESWDGEKLPVWEKSEEMVDGWMW